MSMVLLVITVGGGESRGPGNGNKKRPQHI